jgi:hypothetical protein
MKEGNTAGNIDNIRCVTDTSVVQIAPETPMRWFMTRISIITARPEIL